MRAFVVLLSLCCVGMPLACQTRRATPPLRSLRDLGAYVGTYPCQNGLLKTAVLRHAVMSVLGPDSSAYSAHIGQSGCGQIEREHDFLVMDVSQLHVGGYSSLIVVRPIDGAVWVYWLDGPVAFEAPTPIYGRHPVPRSVLDAIERRMNEVWGHVAHFRVRADSVIIEPKQ